jgi:hypothetical protein
MGSDYLSIIGDLCVGREGKVMMPKTHIILKRKQFENLTVLVMFGS